MKRKMKKENEFWSRSGKWTALAMSGALLLGGCAPVDDPVNRLSTYDGNNTEASAGTQGSSASGESATSPESTVIEVILPTQSFEEEGSSGESSSEDFSGEASTEESSDATSTEATAPTEESTDEAPGEETAKVPKYVFLFIGDGCGYAQIQAASLYQSALANANDYRGAALSFTEFPVVGSVTNENSDTRITDSAAAATAIATGNKTITDRINISPDATTVYETIAEKLKKQLDFQIGIVSSANLNHATPAGFFGHQLNRGQYYELGQELVLSGFDYFAGGQLRLPTGDGSQTNIYDLAIANGYQVLKDGDLMALTPDSDQILMVSDLVGQSKAIPYYIDGKDSATLAEYVRGGIITLSDADQFFMMVEGGLIDWAAHANDGATLVQEVLQLDAAVQQALAFYEQHPDETLILVTADHETGGLSLGTSNTEYQFYPQLMSYQKISYWEFNEQYVNKFRNEQTDWETVLWEVRALFGLTMDGTYQSGDPKGLLMTPAEVEELHQAYADSLAGVRGTIGTAAFEKYGEYEPLSYTVCRLLAKKCGMNFSSIYHTASPIPIYAIGAGAEEFGGVMDNTEIYWNLAELLGVE